MTIKGTSGDDNLTGTSGNDVFNLVQGGNDTVSGLAGNDEFSFGATFGAGDIVNGGDGDDTIKLDGDYGGAGPEAMFSGMTSVERILLTGVHNYEFQIDAASNPAGHTMTIDATHVHGVQGTDLVADPSAAGDFVFEADKVDVGSFGGGAGDDTFEFTGHVNSYTAVYGEGGNDTIVLDGDYTSKTLHYYGNMINSVENLVVDPGHSYDLSIDTSAKVAGEALRVDGHKLLTTDVLNFRVSHGFVGTLDVSGGHGDDVLTCADNASVTLSGGDGDDTLAGAGTGSTLYGGDGNDTFDLTYNSGRANGADQIHGGAGDDTINMGANLAAADQVDGGSGNDTVSVTLAHQTLILGATTLLHIETFDYATQSGTNSAVFTNNGTVAAGTTLTVNMQSPSETFDGSAETDGQFVFNAANSDDMVGGALSDTFVFHGGVSLTGATADVIGDLNFANDIIAFHAVTGIDAEVTTGTLSMNTFDSDMAAAVGAGQLAAGHAVLFMPNAGDQAGQLFLVVDGNGTAGWQSGSDLVLSLGNAINPGDISTANFTA